VIFKEGNLNTHDPHGTSRLVGRSNHRHYWPLVKGGQGRSVVEVESNADLIFSILKLAVLAVLLGCLLALFCGK
jgi:hypothetical protein